jgi:hypothetical protein
MHRKNHRSESQHEHMSVVLDNLHDHGLNRAHVITAFFWAGVGSGHRLRQYYESVDERQRGDVNAMRSTLGLQRNDPFCVGWGFGWELELGKSDG